MSENRLVRPYMRIIVIPNRFCQSVQVAHLIGYLKNKYLIASLNLIAYLFTKMNAFNCNKIIVTFQTYHPKPTKTVLSTTQRRPATKPATTSTTSLTTRTTTTTTTPKPRTTTTTPYTTPTTRRTTLAEIAAATDETTVTEQAIDLSSPVDSNDVLEDPNQVTRYTLSAAKTAGTQLIIITERFPSISIE